MRTPVHGRQKKGAKTEAILKLLEAQGVSRPSAIGPQTGLSAKEVSSRISMLVSQGRVARERNEENVQIVRLVGWDIQNSRIMEPEAVPEVPMLQQLWGLPHAAQLIALADAVAEDAKSTPSGQRTRIMPPDASPFVQVLLQTRVGGRVNVYTHCLADDDEPRSPTRTRRIVRRAPLGEVTVATAHPAAHAHAARRPARGTESRQAALQF